MAGRNQHYIPQFFQRGFGVARSGKRKPKEIWIFRKNQPPEMNLIKSTAVEWDFYSSPSADGSATLDDKITETETPLAQRLTEVRNLPIGSTVDRFIAADIVMQLTPRSSHIRTAMESGFRQITTSLVDMFSNQNQIERLLGLHEQVPTEVFQGHFRRNIQNREEIKNAQLPASVLERIAFHVAKEQFNHVIGNAMPLFHSAFNAWLSGTEKMARDGHNNSLERSVESRSVRQDRLEAFRWRIESSPLEGAILPDCVAIGWEPGEPISPLMFLGQNAEAAVMPISSQKLLVGSLPGSAGIDITQFNYAAAASSHDFFLATQSVDTIEALSGSIGSRSDSTINEALKNAFGRASPGQPGKMDDPDASQTGNSVDSSTKAPLAYEVVFRNCAQQEEAERIAAAMQGIINSLAAILPLNRLEGVIVAGDYPAALRDLDRGIDGLAPLETVSSDIGYGVARTVMVLRDGVPKGRIILDVSIGSALIDEDIESLHWALGVFIHELTLVALIEYVDTALPDVILRPVQDSFQGWLYRQVDPALHGYIASHFSVSFGNNELTITRYRELLINALDHFKQTIEPARLAYRYDGDLDKLIEITLPPIGFILQFAAELLGACAAEEVSPLDDQGKLATALESLGLSQWISAYGRDLEALRLRLGRWESFDEFLAFARHVERLMWSVGMIPWNSPDGIRVEVSIGTDAAALWTSPSDAGS